MNTNLSFQIEDIIHCLVQTVQTFHLNTLIKAARALLTTQQLQLLQLSCCLRYSNGLKAHF